MELQAKYYRMTVRGAHIINDKQGWMKALRITYFRGAKRTAGFALIELNRLLKSGKLIETKLNRYTKQWEDIPTLATKEEREDGGN